ncbi:DUF2889 domain-containing protein [Novosphingobium rosa]|uniref:DUF2889 domain-containing protein n=1 Tax=Novosphingobium rosa TaxID=76978 RepID=UPI00082E9FA2|nr:DUF2889 domain-containing protein [Novosphingobium rosa]
MSRLSAYTPAPAYGTGVYRRRIRLCAEADRVTAEMEDDPHAMRCRITHRGGIVTALEADFHRHPLTTCPGAHVPLGDLVGMAIDITAQGFFAGGRARQNCTHMLDLAWLAMRQAARGPGERLYAIDIADAVEDHARGVLRRDGEEILAWEVAGGGILSPAPFAGRPLLNGFVGWALAALEDDTMEAALVLQKGFFVADSRRVILPSGPILPEEYPALGGACFGFAMERIAAARRNNASRRDFTDRPEDLLAFRP